MSALERLASLTAHGIPPDTIWGGKAELTQAEVAALLSGCTRFQTALMMGKHCLDVSARHSAWSYWFRWCMAQRWETKVLGQIERFSIVTLDEFFDPRQCPTCNGAGEVMFGPKVVVCESCHGQPVQPYSDRRIAKAIGMREHLTREWQDRLQWARDNLAEQERQAENRVRRNARDPA